MTNHPNPVGRLYGLLQTLKGIPPNITIHEAWTAVFATTPISNSDLIYEFNELIKLIEAGKSGVRRLPNIDTDLFIKDLLQVEYALGKAFVESSINSDIGSLFQSINEGVM